MNYLLAAILVFCGTATGAGEFQVLDAADNPDLMMRNYLNGLADAAFARRAAERDALKTPEEIAEYQRRLRRFFLDSLHLPERTPLNATIIGSGRKPTFRYEKVIFESRPRFRVTGVMFLPLSEPPYPGVLVPCGHSANGKAMDKYQIVCINLAENGIAAFIYDPIGQGERSQIIKEDGKPQFGNTLEHTFCGVGGILLGGGAAAYCIWDGLRAIDYLCERGDIDPDRIGCTGNSGGGTMTSYLMALDPRIKCAAPSCYLTSLKKLLAREGPQDAEQNIHGQIAAGLDHADYIMLRAPAPTLVCCATRDFFDIAGTWDSFRDAKRLYSKLGAADRLNIVEADEEHGFTPVLRQAATQWMCRFLLGKDEPTVESTADVLSESEMQCTPRGQVLLDDGERSTFDIDTETERNLAQARRRFLRRAGQAEIRSKVRELAGVRPLQDIPTPEADSVKVIEREGYKVELIAIRPEPGIVLPALAFLPPKSSPNLILYCNGNGKAADAAPGGPIEKLMRAKNANVLAVDLRGLGETAAVSEQKGFNKHFGGGWKDYFRAYMLDKTMVGMRAEDILACAKLAGQQADPKPKRIHIVACGEAAIPALHAAALEPDLIRILKIDCDPNTWTECVKRPVDPSPLVNTVYGALEFYDLPDLYKLAR